MLHADKRALEQRVTLDLLKLRQKELAFLTSSCFTLAQPAALFAGFAYTSMSQVEIPESVPWWLRTLFFEVSMIAMALAIAATVRTSYVGLRGPALALRGQPGSMHRAVETMGPCFMGAWAYFMLALIFIFLSTIVILIMKPNYFGNSILSVALIVVGMALIYRDMGSLHAQFNLKPHEVVGAKFTRSEVATMVRQCAADAILVESSGAHRVQASAPPPRAQRPKRVSLAPAGMGTRNQSVFFLRAGRGAVLSGPERQASDSTTTGPGSPTPFQGPTRASAVRHRE
mgnify:FL=1